jgi:HSP20 family protein
MIGVVRSRVYSVPVTWEVGDFSDEVRGIFDALGREPGAGPLSGECTPAMDVFESDEVVEIVMDLPAIEPDAVRVLVKRDGVLIAGLKSARRGRGDSSFHLVERGFGRFARSVRLGRSCDTSRATATLSDGELRVRLPKIPDRRGRAVQIQVERRPHADTLHR